MVFILLCIVSTYAILTVYNSNTSTTEYLSYKLITFGNSGLYSVYGRPIFISNDTTSSILQPLKGCFGVFWNYSNQSIANLSLLAQNSGALGAIFVSQTDDWKFSTLPINPNDKNMANILVLGILQRDANPLQAYPGRVWMTYKHDLIQTLSPVINFYINGNYTEDKIFAKELQKLNSIIPLQKSNFGLYLDVPDSNDININRSKDCIIYYDLNFLCMRGNSIVLGMDKVSNAVLILKYFDYTTNFTIFFETLMNLYNNCEFDYSRNCILAQLTGINPISVADFDYYRDYWKFGYDYPCYTINNIEINSPSSLQSTYCLSFNNPPAVCSRCSASCPYPSIHNSICDTGCNVSSCAYDNFNCIRSGNCYNFLLGNGQCDSVCPKDPDCFNGNSSNICSPGCLYSDMKKGLCPSDCDGFCFSNCSNEYCSPGCSYQDLSVGICSKHCTKDCLKYCFNYDTCAIGCLYSDMLKGLCPLACSGRCFHACSKKYCSPNCLYSDLELGKCSSDCTPECLEKCLNVSDKCNPECLYSDMAKGLCPASCSGDCFKHCNSSIYCSANCLYSDLSIGLCTSSCSNYCISECNTSNVCSPDCYYRDMLELKNCSNLCTEECFSSCDSSIYCSPGCKFDDLKSGQCSLDCTDSCLSDCNMKCSDSCHKDYVKYGYCPYPCDMICCRIDKSSSSGDKLSWWQITLISVGAGVGLILLCYCPEIMMKVLNCCDRYGYLICCDCRGCCNCHCCYCCENCYCCNCCEIFDNSRVIPSSRSSQSARVRNSKELRPIRFDFDVKFVGDAVCSIDLSDFSIGESVILTPCFHLFHLRCINEWLVTVSGSKKCPNCNFKLDDIFISLN